MPPSYTGRVTLPTDSDHYYLALGEHRYRPTIHVQGAWSDREQHMAPVSGLLTHAIERHEPRDDLQLGRITFDILGMIPAEESTVRTRTLRPGRTIELIEATLSVGDRDVVRASAWRLSRQDTSAVAATEDPPLPSPEETTPWEGMRIWAGGYIASVEFRAADDARAGRGRAWLRSPYGLVDGEESTDLARYVGLVDTANGIGVRRPPTEWMFPNTDLTIHLHRAPRLPWVGMDGRVSWGATGLGVTSTVLHDSEGPVGYAHQVLTVRPQPGR
ncbi:thioesterase family protein [Ornithinimicrobium sediminis]|uniref:thioesterase family protein n=1 Tax=Ornithinimicrobium sediminis TaxID=2904603 RepID=UPI0038CD8905